MNRLRTTILAVIGVAAVVSVAGFFLTKESVDDAEAAGATVVDMVNFEFDPATSSISSGGKLLIHNSDPFVHDFTLDELGVAVTVGPGSDALVDLSQAAPGTYDYLCTIHTDADGSGMTGVVTIEG